MQKVLMWSCTWPCQSFASGRMKRSMLLLAICLFLGASFSNRAFAVKEVTWSEASEANVKVSRVDDSVPARDC
jgi:hypothetical protein